MQKCRVKHSAVRLSSAAIMQTSRHLVNIKNGENKNQIKNIKYRLELINSTSYVNIDRRNKIIDLGEGV